MKDETRGNRDEWRGVGGVTEIEWTWDGEGIVGNRWSRTDFVRDPPVIQYLTQFQNLLSQLSGDDFFSTLKASQSFSNSNLGHL